MGEKINCKVCGKPFEPKIRTNLCPECFTRDESEFAKIREYLYIHPYAKIFEVVNNLNVSVSKIKRYLKEERLEILEKNNAFLKCEACGSPICSGTLCDSCLKQSNHNYKSFYTGNNKSKQKTGYSYLPSNKSLKRA